MLSRSMGHDGTVKVLSSNNMFVLGTAREILRDHAIPYAEKSEGTGGYMQVLTGGQTIYPAAIYVKEEDAPKAQQLLAVLEDHDANDREGQKGGEQ